MIIKGYLLSVVYGLFCLFIGFLLYKIGVDKKITRKLVHILVGFEWVILYHFMGASWHFLAVCVAFLMMLAIAHRKKLMPMISSDSENSPGTVYYALAMTIMASLTLLIPKMLLPFGIGVFCTSLGDGLAGLVGQGIDAPWNIKIYKQKTLVGAVVNFASCFAATFVFSNLFGLSLSIANCLAIAIFALELELFTGRGLDNISITLGCSLLAFVFMNVVESNNYILPILLTPLIIVFAKDRKALTTDGIIAAVIVDIVISITLGNLGFLLLLTFFLGGILTDKIKKTGKKTQQKEEKSRECRDSLQVLANSAVAAICSVLYFVTDDKIFFVAFVASLAEALADTAASGIGVLSGRAFDPFRMKPCAPGVSGGMSLLGTISSALGALVIAVIAFAFGAISINQAIVAALAGTFGAIFDSLLGSLMQAKYKCRVCGAIVEKNNHCGQDTLKHSGFAFVTNDTVNFFGTLFAAALTDIIYY